MLGDDEIKELQDEINMLEEQLRQRKRELSEKRYASLRASIAARKEADQLLSEELKALGVRRVNWHPFI
jgi:cell division septum initiation protein DivIVA